MKNTKQNCCFQHILDIFFGKREKEKQLYLLMCENVYGDKGLLNTYSDAIKNEAFWLYTILIWMKFFTDSDY